MAIEELGLSVRAFNALKRAGIDSLSQWAVFPDEQKKQLSCSVVLEIQEVFENCNKNQNENVTEIKENFENCNKNQSENVTEIKEEEKRGGIRTGAGRKKKSVKSVVVRVPENMVDKVKKMVETGVSDCDELELEKKYQELQWENMDLRTELEDIVNDERSDKLLRRGEFTFYKRDLRRTLNQMEDFLFRCRYYEHEETFVSETKQEIESFLKKIEKYC